MLMKTTKLFFVAICLLLLAPIKGWCDITVQVGPDIEITISHNSYTVEFNSLDFMIVNDTLPMGQMFSRMVYPGDHFGFYETVDSTGMPMLPLRSMELQLPEDATEVHVDMLDITSDDQFEGFWPGELEHYYFPYQNHPLLYVQPFQFNTSYYQSNGTGWCRGWYDVSEIYDIYGSKGFHFGIIPVMYMPSNGQGQTANKLYAARHISYTITFDGSSLLDLMTEHLIGTHTEDAVLYFDNYSGLGFEQASMPKGRYAIFTNPEFSDPIQSFIDYKTYLGYDVDLYTADFNALGASGTRSYIKSVYDNPQTKPRFVLLVGNDDLIPSSAGEIGDSLNPPTDIYYACLTYNNIQNEDKSLSPSVHLGRWPVENEEEIINITEKTIRTELNLADEPRYRYVFQGYAGIDNVDRGDGSFIDFIKPLRKLDSKIFSHLSVQSLIYDGWQMRNDSNQIISNNLRNNTWMLLYNGHGWYDGFYSPYSFKQHDIQNLDQGNIDYFPFFFAAACRTGGHDAENTYNFVNHIICKYIDKGAVSHFGSSVTSYDWDDDHSFFRIFSELKDNKNKPITMLTNNGMTKYFHSWRTKDKRRQVKKYNFFGDPSIYIYGLNRITANPFSLSRRPNSTNNNLLITPSVTNEKVSLLTFGQGIESVVIYSAFGSQVYNGKESEIPVQDFADGVYFVIVRTVNGNLLNDRFIVKH